MLIYQIHEIYGYYDDNVDTIVGSFFCKGDAKAKKL